MKSFCASLILLNILYVTVQAQDCSTRAVGECSNQIKKSFDMLNRGSVGDLRYTQQQINEICKANAETRRCYFDVLEPCKGKTNAVTVDVLRGGNEVVNNRGDVTELCDTPKFRDGYGELANCYQQHGPKVGLDCVNKAAVEMGVIKEGESMMDQNVVKRITQEAVAANESEEKKTKDACCMTNKANPCLAEGLKDHCGVTMKEFYLNIPAASVDAQIKKCVAHKDECAAAINLTAGFTLILTTIVATLFAK